MDANRGNGNNRGEAQAAANGDAEPREKRSRDRYGRERGQRGDRPNRNGADEQPQAQRDLQPALEGFAPPAAQEAQVSAAMPAAAAANLAPPVAVVAQPVAAEGLPKVPTFVLPIDSLVEVAQQSGLQWINSDADKISAAQAAIASQPTPIHVPRERPQVVAVDEGPLVLVETKRDLRTMQLPFEQSAN